MLYVITLWTLWLLAIERAIKIAQISEMFLVIKLLSFDSDGAPLVLYYE